MSSWDRVRLQGPNARRALLGGVVATLLLTGLMYLGHAVGVDIWTIPAMIASAIGFGRYITPADPLWMWGVVLYAIFGVLVLPLCYAYWVFSYLPGPACSTAEVLTRRSRLFPSSCYGWSTASFWALLRGRRRCGRNGSIGNNTCNR